MHQVYFLPPIVTSLLITTISSSLSSSAASYLDIMLPTNVRIMINCIAEIIIYVVILLKSPSPPLLATNDGFSSSLPPGKPSSNQSQRPLLPLENGRKIALILFFHATNNNLLQLKTLRWHCMQHVILLNVSLTNKHTVDGGEAS